MSRNQLCTLCFRAWIKSWARGLNVTGESPGTPTETGQWNARPNQLPAAWEMLWADLESRKPALFVDTAAAGWNGYDKFPITGYPRLATYLHQHYRPVETLNRVVIYRRVR